MREFNVMADSPGESLDDLLLGGMKLFQSREGYRFSLDAVLLAHFPLLDGIKRAVDLGAGSGVISLLLAYLSPSLCITAIEIQENMVKRAQKSIVFNHLEGRIGLVQADIRDIGKYVSPGSADLVISNPPFWKKGEGRISPNAEKAIARHELEVELKDIIRAAAYLLSPRGCFCLIQNAERLQESLRLFSDHDLSLGRIRPVYSLPGRKAKMLLLEGQKGGTRASVVLPPLFVYESPGVYSKEVRGWYKSCQTD